MVYFRKKAATIFFFLIEIFKKVTCQNTAVVIRGGTVSPFPTAGPSYSSILGHFGPFSDKWEFSLKTWLFQFWLLLVPQLYTKKKKTNKRANPEKSAVATNEHINQAILGLFGPLSSWREWWPLRSYIKETHSVRRELQSLAVQWKKSVDIDILITSRKNGERINLQSIRISAPARRMKNWYHFSHLR